MGNSVVAIFDFSIRFPIRPRAVTAPIGGPISCKCGNQLLHQTLRAVERTCAHCPRSDTSHTTSVPLDTNLPGFFSVSRMECQESLNSAAFDNREPSSTIGTETGATRVANVSEQQRNPPAVLASFLSASQNGELRQPSSLKHHPISIHVYGCAPTD